jgi:EAL domain-containing protein (putative c-di-GMP-specific phosphodiesterase class I)
VEALLRWNHPQHGRIGPGEFVALAEHTELIAPLTEFVIDRAIADVGAIPGLRVAINVSARNLENRHFASNLLERLDAADFDTARLEVEITESALSNDPERASVVLDELRSAGVGVSIDDFGTGYSSFGTLRDTKIDRIKIDRSLVTRTTRSTTDLHIVRAMIDLAHGLELAVVAEGVETLDVWHALVELGCDDAQGYLMSKPIPSSELGELVGWSFTSADFARTEPDASDASLAVPA